MILLYRGVSYSVIIVGHVHLKTYEKEAFEERNIPLFTLYSYNVGITNSEQA